MESFIYEKDSRPVYLDRHVSNILNKALEGEVFPSVSLGFLLGHCFRANKHLQLHTVYTSNNKKHYQWEI